MKIYLDENLSDKRLIELLRDHGFDPCIPAEVHLAAASDEAQFNFARRQKIPILTKDASDFLLLHQRESNHAGVIVIYEESNPSKNMSAPEIVTVLENLKKKERDLKKRFFVLNQYRIKT